MKVSTCRLCDVEGHVLWKGKGKTVILRKDPAESDDLDECVAYYGDLPAVAVLPRKVHFWSQSVGADVMHTWRRLETATGSEIRRAAS
nr:hypothetical protein BaRGS_016397 [Batillaria attramentaria]